MTLDMSSALATYAAESRELLDEMERALLALEADLDNAELINSVFRSAHTIKGSGGLFGFTEVVELTHDAETLLDAVRSGRLRLDPERIALLLECRDQMGAVVEAAIAGEISEELRRSSAALRARLRAAHGAGGSGGGSQRSDRAAHDAWHISLRCGRDLLRDGMDPAGLLHYLLGLGELVCVNTLTDALPPLSRIDPTTCYLGFEIQLASDADKQTIEGAFDFVRESSRVRILPPHSKPAEWAELIRSLPEGEAKLGEILVRSGALTQRELTEALGAQITGGDPRPLGEILVDHGSAPPEAVHAALEKQGRGNGRGDHYVRVEAAKLDRLVDLVGELVIANTVTSLRAAQTNDGALLEAVAASGRFIEEVRDAALGLRMVQIGGAFNRFQRVVHDLSRELGKQIELSISGGETELDKTVVDRITDPLTHLVRNAVDHGIEAPEARSAAGKPPQGRLHLSACHETGSIVIELSDDGRGLDRALIARKAMERGLIKSAEGMPEEELFRLIFAPGFSTADQVSSISGRGVGMDVVKRTIDDLRGSVEVESAPGEGTTIRLRLPLTLAIIDGFLVAAGGARYVVPLEMVEECLELHELGRRDYVDLRGEVLPFLRLRDLLATGGESRTPERQSVVVVGYAGKKAGLVVDSLLGELQTVIKPLGPVFSTLKWVSGCTVLDVGQVGLILDVPALLAQAERRESWAAA